MQKHVDVVVLVKSFSTGSYYLLSSIGVDTAENNFFFSRIGRSDLTRKLEKVGPFECDELEKHCRVSPKS